MQSADLDIFLLRILNSGFTPAISVFFVFASYFLYAYVSFLVFYFWRTKQKIRLVHFIIVLAVGLLLVYFLKYSIARPRPYETYTDIKTAIIKSDPSFPSSHVFVSFLCLHFIPKRPKLVKILAIVYLAGLMPFGSVYMGVHFPSDVLVAAIIGLLIPILILERVAIRVTKSLSSHF